MRRKVNSWVTLRNVVQWLALSGFLVLWVKTAGAPWPAEWSKLPANLDPLIALAVTLSTWTLATGLLLSLVIVGLTLIFGRAWCGWLCPLGTVLDIFNFKNARSKKPVPETWRKGKFILLAVILIAALFGNLSLLILDPITLWVRTLSGGVAPALDTAFTAAEHFLANLAWLNGPLVWLDQLVRPAILPLEPVGARLVWLPVLILTVIILLNLRAERFWCRYLCPLGGLLGWISRIALVKRQVDSDCSQCGLCHRVCPTGTIDPARGYASDPAECTLCMNCLSSCPQGKTSFRPSISIGQNQAYDLNRRDFLVGGAAALTGLAVLGTEILEGNAPTTLIRPPGVEGEEFLSQCVRCGLCMRACPTGALQASITESGLSGFLTPILVPRFGYCLYSCNQCGQVCPSGAIPPLTLEEKKTAVIGHAYIDQNRCLPWADGTSCIVCEEMCPLPEKAITLEEREIVRSDGTVGVIRLPHVQRDLCIGCGICENKCPLVGEAAIRVYRVDLT